MKSTTAFFSTVLLASAVARSQEVSLVSTLPTEGSGHYLQNRAPLVATPLQKLPIGSIRPQGWLLHQLELEAAGMGGHLEEVSRFVQFQGNGWTNPAGKDGWEELPYWLKGFGDLGYVLQDDSINARSKRWIDAIITTQQPDGWFGPNGLKTSLNGRPDLWPHMPILNAMQSWHEYSNDPRVLAFMTNYFKWLNQQPPDTFSLGYWPALRWGDCLGSVHWLYNRTGDAYLLELAKKMHENSAKWSTGIINGHNVNFAQGFREPAQYFVQSHAPADRAATYANYSKMMAKYGQFPGGGFAADENTRPDYTDARQGFETCGVVEYMSSFEQLTLITGDADWADRCEELAFNTLPAALTPDLKALHYLTSANMVQLDQNNKAPGIDNGGTMLSYSPSEVYRCCQHNHTMGWPYYAENLFLATSDGGLLANLYSAAQVTAKVGAAGTTVTITESGEYPFSEEIRFKISVPSGAQVAFPFYLRMPAWARTAQTTVNGKPVPFSADDASKNNYVRMTQDWKDGDEVVLHLGMSVTQKTWPKSQGGSVSIYYGPLAFAYSPGEKWAKYGGSQAWPEFEVFAAGPFNYGLDLQKANDLKVVRKAGPLAAQPFTGETVPLSIEVPARKIPQWTKDENSLLHAMQASPARTDAPLETITLIPMGAARLRISSFPVASTYSDAVEWKLPPRLPRVSHCFSGDTPLAIVDDVIPASSHDSSIRRFTWWDHKGTTEWIELEVGADTAVSSVSVYWFDDSPTGGCRPPLSWKVLYKDGGQWKPVLNPSTAGTATDTFNKITFQPVHTAVLRLEVKLQEGFSAGILEAQVNGAVLAGAGK